MVSPIQRSLAKLREEGYTCAITEHWNHFAKIRQDLFGFVDILCVREGETLAVQTTSGAGFRARIKKVLSLKTHLKVRQAGWRVVVHGWRKLKTGWACREREIK